MVTLLLALSVLFTNPAQSEVRCDRITKIGKCPTLPYKSLVKTARPAHFYSYFDPAKKEWVSCSKEEHQGFKDSIPHPVKNTQCYSEFVLTQVPFQGELKQKILTALETIRKDSKIMGKINRDPVKAHEKYPDLLKYLVFPGKDYEECNPSVIDSLIAKVKNLNHIPRDAQEDRGSIRLNSEALFREIEAAGDFSVSLCGKSNLEELDNMGFEGDYLLSSSENCGEGEASIMNSMVCRFGGNHESAAQDIRKMGYKEITCGLKDSGQSSQSHEDLAAPSPVGTPTSAAPKGNKPTNPKDGR